MSTASFPVRVEGRINTNSGDPRSKASQADASGTSSDFPELLSRMGTGDDAPAGRPASAFADGRSAWGPGIAKNSRAQIGNVAMPDPAMLAAVSAGESLAASGPAGQTSGVVPAMTPKLGRGPRRNARTRCPDRPSACPHFGCHSGSLLRVAGFERRNGEYR